MSTAEPAQNGETDNKPPTDTSSFDIPIISDIGIIYPPPEVRNIIEKTAEFVHKNGIEFEDKIRQREVQNPKFSFLNRNDPYFMYYKHILYEFTLYPNREKIPEKPSFLTCLPQIEKRSVKEKEAAPVKKWKQLVEVDQSANLSNPLPKYEFINDIVPLAPVDLDTVKITAQFVAKNGRQFLQSLLQREMKNYIFDFLKPQHNIYPYFIKLVEQYSKILAPSSDMLSTLQNEAANRSAILEKVRIRYAWLVHNDKERRKDSDQSKNKALHGLIDWHEFVVVETITFREDEQADLPPPVSLEQLGARLISHERLEKAKTEPAKRVEVPDKKVETILAEEEEVKLKEPLLVKEVEPKKVIDKKDVKPRAQEMMMVSPVTGELIPADKMEQHLKQSLLDPRYKEQKRKYLDEKRQLDLMAASGPSITSHLKDLAQRRSDIFGPGHEETVIGKKLDEKETPHVKKAAPVNFESMAPPPVSSQSYRGAQGHNISDKASDFNSNARKKPNVPPLPQEMGQNMYMPPPQPPPAMYPPHPSSAPPPSTQYYGLPPPLPTHSALEGRPQHDESLIPEDEFLASYGSIPINIQIRIPNMPELVNKFGWQLQGQIEHITVNLSDTISALKNQILQITGMPTSKQKILIGASRFAKDNFTLAYYNVHSNTYIALLLKERGGKR